MHEPIESDLLRTFLVVAETSNFSAAAQRIGRTQSAVSTQIKRLEQTIGETLFERGARGVLLTRQGIQLVPYARRIIDLLNEAAATIRSKPLDGPVRIGIPEEYSQTVLPAALAAFAVRHPAVEVTVSCDYTVRNLAALERNELDLAVVFDWSDETKGEVICIDPTVWVTSMVHRLHDIDPLPIATYRNSTWSRDFALRSLEQIGRNYRIAFIADTGSGLKNAVIAGLAVTTLSRSNIPPGCRELTADDGFPPVDSSKVVLRRSTYRSSEAVRELAEMIRDAFQPIPAPPMV
ncbi:LysR family transcriptional regulator [Rhizobium leguminosarum]|uniref:LysR substrate-binding domain-containing protein n=1 Tax=Rhizobium leguminosarum TaxID=384 RepID=UPI001C942B5F|nr:LysR substrate-binding domain-containing protein [Rhizobium leguminosarum]MBY5611445.1 LysR family transcriptional regulator [Rhizobium leguminosarum]MBY5623882.1 LysR family transcriptional regulator [Rhizobium leguminosarum]MBY5643574.1 LysR family transcriptional regulator [Rhizobium leguminosarum]MBY5659241.1 LysR family transcriptional regulator [Rhizobium leguminosarum]MBY5669836.1 LysR family transcriptional regulator [Rhizobium leguminosarum]